MILFRYIGGHITISSGLCCEKVIINKILFTIVLQITLIFNKQSTIQLLAKTIFFRLCQVLFSLLAGSYKVFCVTYKNNGVINCLFFFHCSWGSGILGEGVGFSIELFCVGLQGPLLTTFNQLYCKLESLVRSKPNRTLTDGFVIVDELLLHNPYRMF